MKHRTTYFMIVFLLITISCISQEKNYLTLTEYNNILVDGVKWGDIKNTRGDISKMQALFGNTLSIETANEPSPSIGFGDKGFYLSFEDRSGVAISYTRVVKRVVY